MFKKNRFLLVGLMACLAASIVAGQGTARTESENPPFRMAAWGGPGSNTRIGKPFRMDYQLLPSAQVTDLVISLKLPPQLRLLKVTIDGKPASATSRTWKLIDAKSKRPFSRKVVVFSFSLSKRCANNGKCHLEMDNRVKTKKSDLWQSLSANCDFIIRR